MANNWENRKRAWWEVFDLAKEVVGEDIEGYKQKEVEKHGDQDDTVVVLFSYTSALISGF